MTREWSTDDHSFNRVEAPVRNAIRWLSVHGAVRARAAIGHRRGDPQARMIADPALWADPVPFYEELRAVGPLVPCRFGYLTVDYTLTTEMLRSDDFHAMPLGSTLPRPLRWVERHTRGGQVRPAQPPSMLVAEAPQHIRYRKLVSSIFTASAVAALRDRVAQIAAEMLDAMRDTTGVVDVVEQYCSWLPVVVIADILGVPQADREQVRHFGDLAAPALDIGLPWRQYRQMERGVAGFNAWLGEHLRQLQRAPGDDLMSQLIQAADEGVRLNDTELRATAGILLAAGFRNTVNFLGNGMRILMDSPESLAKLARQPELWPNAVDEVLRIDSPVRTKARVAARDAELAGRPIRRGTVVVSCVAGANRDPAVFDDPHRFDIERPNASKHLSFSTGRHYCLAAALARAEGEIGFSSFFQRFPDARLAGAGIRSDTRVLSGWSSLPVTLQPTSNASIHQ